LGEVDPSLQAVVRIVATAAKSAADVRGVMVSPVQRPIGAVVGRGSFALRRSAPEKPHTIVILSAAKDLLSLAKNEQQILRYAQDDDGLRSG
jgi:hypothetical protein